MLYSLYSNIIGVTKNIWHTILEIQHYSHLVVHPLNLLYLEDKEFQNNTIPSYPEYNEYTHILYSKDKE